MMSSQLTHHASKSLRRARAVAGVAILAVAGLALAGCSAGNAANTNSSSGTGGSGSGKGVTIAVMGGAPSDPFWSTVKNGAQAAEKSINAAGGQVKYVSMPDYKNFNADAAKLVANLKALNPSAVVLPNWAPDSQNANIKAISSAGIPVIIYNAGADTVKDVGAQIYIGTDDYKAGQAGGQNLAQSGAKDILCINTLPGTVNADARCKGVKDGASGATSSSLNLPSTQFGDPSAVTQAIKSALLQNTKVDAVVTIGAADADSAAAAIKQANASSRVKLGSFDVSSAELARVKDGTQVFAIDQQPYAQGYYATSYAFQLAAYGIALPDNILTGPALVTKANVDKAVAGAKDGTR